MYMCIYLCVTMGEGVEWGGGGPSVSSKTSSLLPLTPLPLVSWQKGSCVWLPSDNRERSEEVFKRRSQVINDFSCIILAFFLSRFSSLPEEEVTEVACVWKVGVASFWKRTSGEKM